MIPKLYPYNSLYIVLKSSNTVPESAVDIKGLNGNSRAFIVTYTYGGLIENILICNIDSITIENATYNIEITYIPTPVPLPLGCPTDCDASIQENIIKNEHGMIVLENTEKKEYNFYFFL